jgi:hypothetical protein
MIDALITSERSLGIIPFTVACVPTGIKTGVVISPVASLIFVIRALFILDITCLVILK